MNAASGDELWRHDPDLGGRNQRSLMWWKNGDQSRLFFTAGQYLIALNPGTGEPIATFGENGIVDLEPAVKDGFYAVSTPGAIFEDLLILGSFVFESEGSSLAAPTTGLAWPSTKSARWSSSRQAHPPPTSTEPAA